jgi:hypothetical protein
LRQFPTSQFIAKLVQTWLILNSLQLGTWQWHTHVGARECTNRALEMCKYCLQINTLTANRNTWTLCNISVETWCLTKQQKNFSNRSHLMSYRINEHSNISAPPGQQLTVLVSIWHKQ